MISTRWAQHPFVALASVVALLAIELLAHQDAIGYGLSWQHSESLPPGLYYNTPVPSRLAFGQVVCFAYKAPTWARARQYLPEGSLVCKPIQGLPGDHINIQSGRVQICHGTGAFCTDGGAVLNKDSHGGRVQAAALPGRIPAGQVYLGSTRVSNSFDSRYLGLQPTNSLVRTIHPLALL